MRRVARHITVSGLLSVLLPVFAGCDSTNPVESEEWQSLPTATSILVSVAPLSDVIPAIPYSGPPARLAVIDLKTGAIVADTTFPVTGGTVGWRVTGLDNPGMYRVVAQHPEITVTSQIVWLQGGIEPDVELAPSPKFPPDESGAFDIHLVEPMDSSQAVRLESAIGYHCCDSSPPISPIAPPRPPPTRVLVDVTGVERGGWAGAVRADLLPVCPDYIMLGGAYLAAFEPAPSAAFSVAFPAPLDSTELGQAEGASVPILRWSFERLLWEQLAVGVIGANGMIRVNVTPSGDETLIAFAAESSVGTIEQRAESLPVAGLDSLRAAGEHVYEYDLEPEVSFMLGRPAYVDAPPGVPVNYWSYLGQVVATTYPPLSRWVQTGERAVQIAIPATGTGLVSERISKEFDITLLFGGVARRFTFGLMHSSIQRLSLTKP